MSEYQGIVARKALEKIKPYVPGKPLEEVERELGITNAIKMASNENPLGPSPKAVGATQKSLAKLHIYPDGACHNLTQKLVEHLKIGAEQIFIGNGSDSAIKLLGETFINPGDNAIMATPSFSEYDFSVKLMGGESKEIPCVDFKHDLASMLQAIDEKTKMVFICNPNNPTGTIITRQEIDDFMARVPENILVVFDEAYYEYVSDPQFVTGLEYIKKGYKNVIVLRTFSKIYGLAALRVGYAVADANLISWLKRAMLPFDVNTLAQVGATAALDDKEHVEKSKNVNEAGKKYLYEKFSAMGLTYTETETNFIWVKINQDCRKVFQAMLREGIIIRTGDIFGFNEYIRVTIGTPEQNERFINTLTKVVENIKK
ncbi:histidinol-phosphate transaminase [Bacillota bacterium LX-D]|nr:histidinol-phosphate transaminase [Bacillota bacterium LX-D]